MIDTHNYFVYENQRWNPVTGYTSHGLPTDRYMWSDASGRHKRTRENTKLLSCHWQWVISLFLSKNNNYCQFIIIIPFDH
jgi:tectonin beta-propeller repeat-containing protein 1